MHPIQVRLPEEIVEKIDSMVGQGYSSRSDFIREAVRVQLGGKKNKAIEGREGWLTALFMAISWILYFHAYLTHYLPAFVFGSLIWMAGLTHLEWRYRHG